MRDWPPRNRTVRSDRPRKKVPEPAVPLEDASALLPQSEEIERVLLRIRRGAPVRSTVAALVSGRHHPLEGADSLFTALANGDRRQWRERLVAAWGMGVAPLGPNERDAAISMLLDALEDTRARERRSGLQAFALWYFGLSAAIAVIVTVTFPGGPPLGWAATLIGAVAVVVAESSVIVAPAYAAYAARQKRQTVRLRAMAATSLGRLRAIEAIGALAGALQDRSQEVREGAAMALHDVLPAVSADHFGAIGGRRTMENLGAALGYQDTLLAYKVLQAIHRVGTAACVPYVERVAREGRTTRIKDLALDVLETLRERERRESEAAVLLRGAATPGTPHQFLLRGAHSAVDAPDQLLRADMNRYDDRT